MFHRDKGAHFTYNQGVGLMRWGALCIAAAAALTVLYAVRDISRITKRDKVSVTVMFCSRITDGSPSTNGEVVFSVVGEDSTGRRIVQQKCGFWACRRYEKYKAKGEPVIMTRYRIKGRSDYITESPWIVLPYEYFNLYPSSPIPTPIWLVPVLIIMSIAFFIMGSKQIRLSMKYPRNDITVVDYDEISGELDSRCENYDSGGTDEMMSANEFFKDV